MFITIKKHMIFFRVSFFFQRVIESDIFNTFRQLKTLSIGYSIMWDNCKSV